MHSVSYDQVHNVLRLSFAGPFTDTDLAAVDPAIMGILKDQDRSGVRTLFDLTHVEAFAVPRPRFAQRARLRPVGKLMRVIVAPPWASRDFGKVYRDEQPFSAHFQPVIVPSLQDAYRVLALENPEFQRLTGPSVDFVPPAPRDESHRYTVRISQSGPRTEPFGWEICRDADSVEAQRSLRTFSTRLEALLDCARAAAALNLEVGEALADGREVIRH